MAKGKVHNQPFGIAYEICQTSKGELYPLKLVILTQTIPRRAILCDTLQHAIETIAANVQPQVTE